MKILKIYFSYLRNEAHYQFLLIVQKLFASYTQVANIVSDLLSQLYPLDGYATPLPVVTDAEGNRLIFARDYEVTCRKNDRPGAAYLIIHGKGAWKGTKTVSFNIVVNELMVN
jgi:hypothetical protein